MPVWLLILLVCSPFIAGPLVVPRLIRKKYNKLKKEEMKQSEARMLIGLTPGPSSARDRVIKMYPNINITHIVA